MLTRFLLELPKMLRSHMRASDQIEHKRLGRRARSSRSPTPDAMTMDQGHTPAAAKGEAFLSVNSFEIEQASYAKSPPETRLAPLTRLLLTGLCLILGAFNMRPALTSLATMLTDVEHSLAVGRLWTGFITTAPVLCFGIFGLLAPWPARRLGLERAIALLLLFLLIGLALRTQVSSVGLVASALISGAAIGMAGALLPVVIRRDFPERAGIATGLYTMAMSISGASAASLTSIIERATGTWTSALAIWSLPALATALAWGRLALISHRAGRMARLPHLSALLRDKIAWNVTAFMGFQAGLAFVVLSWLPTLLRDVAMVAWKRASSHPFQFSRRPSPPCWFPLGNPADPPLRWSLRC